MSSTTEWNPSRPRRLRVHGPSGRRAVRLGGDIRKVLDATTVDWGVEVTLVELKDIQLPGNS